MGGAVSSGRDNNELIDNLMSGNYIRTRQIEMVFRALDRADYMTPEARDQAYKDLAWKNGPLHLSSPCIYSEVMEGLELRPGLSFLNIGSGTGYLSSLVGLILGTSGISHGVEVHPAVVEYATKKISQFIENSPTLDEFDFCEPKYYHGNGLCLSPPAVGYDRVYCGAACPDQYEMYFKQLIKVGGLLVMPLNDTLVQVRRVGENEWVSRCLLNVSFATLRVPTAEEATQLVKLDELRPVRLQLLSRAVIRSAMRGGVLRRHPELRLSPRPPPPSACPRRICIPIEPGGSVEGLNVLHDLDNESGANEMNALLSLVISMGQNRVAGALRFDRVDSGTDDEHDEDDHDGDEPENNHDETSGDAEEAPENEQDQPSNVDLPASDSDDKPDMNGDTSDLDDSPPRPRRPTKRSDTRQRDSHSLRRRPRQGSDSKDDSPPDDGVRDVLRKRRDAKPSTSQGLGSMADVLKNTEEMTKKETVLDHQKTDTVTGPRRDLPGVPSVVEIDLGETSDMEWDSETGELDATPERLGRLEHSDDDTLKNKPKRQKLDSGLGDTPSSSSPDKNKSDGSERSDSPVAGGSSVVDSRSWSPGPEERAHTERRRQREARGGDARRVRLSLLMKQAVRELPLPHALKNRETDISDILYISPMHVLVSSSADTDLFASRYVNLGRCFEF
ncbi:unnamed protein product [Danaus chrysippus]|uniref:(African queen) hypothetical protein n=1 Tax=Danaus chrysippus TaxID=151541 RepID=A0A8J2R973_9NEOP|nr:unnamed protein product [Danaus chrysippus]